MSWTNKFLISAAVILLGTSCSRAVQNTDVEALPDRKDPGEKSAVDAPRPNPPPILPKNIPFPRERAEVPLANPRLPQMEYADGKLNIKVVYPPKDAIIANKDSSFIIGSIGNGYSAVRINGQLVPVWPNGAFLGFVPNPKGKPAAYNIVAYTIRDTVEYVHTVRYSSDVVRPPTPPVVTKEVSPARLVQLTGANLDKVLSDTDKVVIGRPTPTGTYKWFLFPGTIARMTAQRGDMVKIMLDAGREVWVNAKDVGAVARDAKVVREKIDITGASIVPKDDWLDFTFNINQPPAYAVEQPDENTLTLVFYNATTDPDDPIWLATRADPYLIRTSVSKSANRVVYKFEFSRPVYGYLAFYQDGVMNFRMRRPPFVSRSQPLKDLIIAVDAGHPPSGSTGPTGLYEAVPNLAVADMVRKKLEAAGAIVVMTRKDDKPMGLNERTVKARREDAHALVSVHLNAVPDGTNPMRANGTSTYYFQPHSKRFAMLMQRALVPQMGLKDLGAFNANLALVRPTWMPSVLTEGAFLIMPDQEYAMRTPQYQDAYATGIVDGLISFFQSFAR